MRIAYHRHVPNSIVTQPTTFTCISTFWKWKWILFYLALSINFLLLMAASITTTTTTKFGNSSYDECGFEKLKTKQKLPKTKIQLIFQWYTVLRHKRSLKTQNTFRFLANFEYAVINRLWQCQVISFSAPKPIAWILKIKPETRNASTIMGGFDDFTDWRNSM